MTQALRVEVVFGHATQVWRQQVALSPGATVADALAAADRVREAVARCDADLLHDPSALAVHGQPVVGTRTVADGERVEIVGRLRIDPKEARRRRASGG
ncbi:RnfH family protein [Coralloluteibacterium thermophilus]|uniref:RnfH family protein n=1 Tax=Coralloluteibacterium thermophilum TaxID=2707049 RepID=A0ABV9NJX1_9GAMM